MLREFLSSELFVFLHRVCCCSSVSELGDVGLWKRHRKHSELGQNVPGWNLRLQPGQEGLLAFRHSFSALSVTARGNKVH